MRKAKGKELRDMARPRKKSKAGVTLLEVLLAGALVSIVVLAMLEGFTTAARICHENAEVLRADNIAFDLLWRKFHQNYEDQLQQTENKADPPFTGTGTTQYQTSDATSPYRAAAHTFRTWPTYADHNQQVPYRYKEIVGRAENGRGGKWLSVQLQYGPSYSQTHSLSLFRCEISRAMPTTTSN